MYHQYLWLKAKSLILLAGWRVLQRLGIVIVGAIVAAFGYSLFQVPFNLASGGIAGLGILINYFTGFPLGMLFLFLNIPLLVIGYRYLGAWRFILSTLLSILVFSVATDLFTYYLSALFDGQAITDDMLLSAIYGGLVTGVGYGLMYRGSGNPGGTAILGRIIQQKTGIPMGQIYLYTDGLVILAAGFVFGWEVALNSLLVVFLGGIASDYTLEGPSTGRTATIITDTPETLAQALMQGLGRGVSFWNVTGGFTGKTRSMILCTVYRPQVNDLKHIVATVDPHAFVVIGNAHQALGSQFLPLKP